MHGYEGRSGGPAVMWAGGPVATPRGQELWPQVVRGDPDGLASWGRALAAGGAAVSTTLAEIGALLDGLAGASWSGSSAGRLRDAWSAAAERGRAVASRCDRAGEAVGTLAAELAAAQRQAAAASATPAGAHGDLAASAGPVHAAARAADRARLACLRTLDALLCRPPTSRPAASPGSAAAPGPAERAVSALGAAGLVRTVATLPQGYAGLAETYSARLTGDAGALAREWRSGPTPAARRAAAAAVRPAGRAARAARQTAAAARATADAYPAARVAPTLGRSLGATVPRLARTPLGRVPVLGAGLTAAGDAVSIGHGADPARTILGSVAAMGAGEATFGVVGGGLVAAGAVGAAPVLLAGAASMGVAYGVDKGVGYVADHAPSVGHRVVRAGRALARGGRRLWHLAFG